MLEVADYIAETSQTIGDSEERIKNVMISRRKFEYLMKQLKVIKALKNNKNALKSVTIKFYNIFRRKTSF